MSLSQHAMAKIIQVAGGMLRTNGVHPQVFQQASQLMDMTNPRSAPILNDLANHVQTRFSPMMFEQNGVNEFDLSNHLAPWLQNFCALIIKEINAAATPQPQMNSFGGVAAYGSPGGGNYVQPGNAGNVSQYGVAAVVPTGSSQMIVPTGSQPAAAPTPTAVSPATQGTSTMSLTDITLSERPWASIDQPKTDAVETTGYFVGASGDVRVSFTSFEYRLAENDALSIHREIDRLISPDYTRGCYAHLVSGTRLIHVPVGTEKYLELCATAVEGFKDNKWFGVYHELEKKVPVHTWSMLSDFLTPHFLKRLKPLVRQGGVGLSKIATLSDLIAVRNPTETNRFTEHSAYRPRIDALFNQMFASFFNPENVVAKGDSHIGDLIKCDEVTYYKDGFSKYDYGVFSASEDREKMIDEIMQRNTVLRIPIEFIVTNVITGPEMETLLEGKRSLYPFDQRMNLGALLRHADITPLLSELVWVPNVKGHPARSFSMGKDLDDKLNIIG